MSTETRRKYELLADSKITGTEAASFWSRVDRSGQCWLWLGAKSGSGYGTWRKNLSAHRVAYEMVTGRALGRLHLMHTCDNPICVNPAHLVPTTHAGNMRDMCLKGRHARTKLSPAQIKQILAARSQSQRALAQRFGVTQRSVWRVLHGGTTVAREFIASPVAQPEPEAA